MANLYARFEDLVEAFIGPFATPEECSQHAEFCKARGDGAVYHGPVTELPEGAFVLTPKEDREFDYDALYPNLKKA